MTRSSSQSPLFSVLIPSYNRPEYIRQTVDSVLASDFSDFELVISDDRSPRAEAIKGTLREVLSDARARVFWQETNLGEAENRNFLVQASKGKYLIILGDDDLLHAGALRCLRDHLTRYPGRELYVFGYRVIDGAGRRICTRQAAKATDISERHPAAFRLVYYADVLPFTCFHPATFCCEREVQLRFPGQRAAGIGDDFLFLFDFLAAGHTLSLVPAALFSYRKAGGKSASAQPNLSGDAIAHLQARINIYNLVQERYPGKEAAKVVTGEEFFRRFLLSAAQTDPRLRQRQLPLVNVPPALERALRGSGSARSVYLRKGWLTLWRVVERCRILGLGSLRETARDLGGRMRYAVSS